MRGFASPSRGLLVAGEVGGWSPARVEAGRRRAASLDAACGWRLREGGDWELEGSRSPVGTRVGQKELELVSWAGPYPIGLRRFQFEF